MDLFLWEKFLNEHDIKTLIEFGTGYGGMTTYLALQCFQRGIKLVTLDNITSVDFNKPAAKLLNLREAHLCKDVFSDDGINLVVNSLALHGHPACLFFDDGDKPREWKTYEPRVAVGDYLAVHDWEVEFSAGDATGSAIKLQESEPRSGYKTAWFKKVG